MVVGDEIHRPDSAEGGRNLTNLNLPSCQVNMTPKKRNIKARNLGQPKFINLDF